MAVILSKNSYHLKFIYSEKATKFCEIFPLLLTTVHTVKSKGKISQNFVAFSEYMNFNRKSWRETERNNNEQEKPQEIKKVKDTLQMFSP